MDIEQKKEDDFWSTWVDKVQESLTTADSPRVCPLHHLESPKSGSSHRDVLDTKEQGAFGVSGQYRTARARNAEHLPSVAAQNSTKTRASSKELLQVVLVHATLRREVLL